MRVSPADLYAELTDGLARPVRLSELFAGAAARGMAPDAAALEAERARPLAEQEGAEIAQGELLSEWLALPREGAHLVWAMLRPTEEALSRLEAFKRDGGVRLGKVSVRREGRAAVLEIGNPRHLNAEDETTLADTEVAVDLILLDDAIEVGVLRGGLVEQGKHAGRRVFGAGLNLTSLYRGKLPFAFFLDRDLGYVNKIFRGLSGPVFRGPGAPEETTEKLWVAGVETFAIGGACQLLHVVDHVIAERGARMSLPARKEGIVPGASPLRLPRAVGDRLARQAIMSGRELVAGTPEGDLLVDEVVEPGEMDAALAARVAALTSSGIVNAAANRRALRVGAEPLALFQAYMATYAREQAQCHFSPALVANLEEHWNARERRLDGA